VKQILVRNEQTAVAMADEFARATGEEAVAFVIPGPGAANVGAMEEALNRCLVHRLGTPWRTTS
jgi:thiamine pyrophosphate-dependent acetolactate synthase large subunit-like protein